MNPGSVCCSKLVKQSDKGIFCDRCKRGTHTVYCDIDPEEYDNLTAAGDSNEWLHPNCLNATLML